MSRVLLALAVVLCAPSSAAAHAVIRADGATILYSARDATSASTVRATAEDGRVRIVDTSVDGGIDPGRCDPVNVDDRGYIVEVTCPRTASTRLVLDVGSRDDVVEVRGEPMSASLLGGTGNDRLTGGDGPDRIDGGAGQDVLEGAGGDDEMIARDGTVEVFGCGAGSDRAIVDVAEIVDGSCETVERGDAPPPQEEPPPPAQSDTTPPQIDDRAPSRASVRSLAVRASVNEVAGLSASATIRVGRTRIRIQSPQVRATTPGELVTLKLEPSPSQRRTLTRALRRRGARIYAVVTLVAIDDAGNSAATRVPRIRLRR